MSRFVTRLRRAALAAALLTTISLTACGAEQGGGDDTAGGLDDVTVSGDFATLPKVKWNGRVSPDETQTEVLVEGDGESVSAGEAVFAHLWVGNGYSKEMAYNTYDAKTPQLLAGELAPVFAEAVDGHTVGSRVAVAAKAEDAFGEGGNAQLGIGNQDGVVVIVDLLSKVATEPSGEDKEPAKWAPSLIEDGGAITGLDFTDANKPSKNLLDTYVVKGDGPVVEKGQTIAVNYLGQVYDAKKPFDESYSKGDPVSFGIGVGQVISGWDKELVGKPVGSRVILSIPPAEGYGEKGNEQAGIKGTDTLFFVVDILGAA